MQTQDRLPKTILTTNIVSFVSYLLIFPISIVSILIALGTITLTSGASLGLALWLSIIFFIYLFIVSIVTFVYNIIGAIHALRDNKTGIGILFILGILLLPLLAFIASILYYKQKK